MLGMASFMLALVGLITPVLPTTPFILLAGFCWMRSSRRFYGWLRGHRLFGKILGDWQERHAIPRYAKYMAWGMMASSSALLFYRLPSDMLWAAVLVSVLCLMVAIWMASLPDA